MKRNITEKLVKWQNNPNHKPLLVRGARQVGKSYSIVDFGKKYFSGNLHIINFEKNPELYKIFELNLDSNRIISELEFIIGKRIFPKKDLLFFDEIQECPKAIMSLRYFYEQNPDFYVIAAGSLLEFTLQDISFPVGRLHIISMFPMTFEEFLIACDNSLIAERIKNIDEVIPLNIVEKINYELNKYFVVGGMPECVQTYVTTGSFVATAKTQTDLISTFRQDFSKYAIHANKHCLNSVLSSVAKKVGEQIKYSHLSKDFSNPTIKKAFNLLETARLFTKVNNVSPNGIPLGASKSEKIFKAIFLDIGLLSNLSGLNSKELISKQKLSTMYNGKMAEQFVGQELRAIYEDNVFYWRRAEKNSNAEIDYIVANEQKIIPIEVKSGKAGKLKSMHYLLEKFTNIEIAYIFTENKYGELLEQKLRFFPLFCANFIKK